ncbi:IL2RA protein, partial [Odontophorus gujanensis]|nr:IL2RA protein [Odontophorus gujanensis]
GKCPQLDTEFADVAAETYPLKTKLRYECDNGYRRRSGISLTIRCQNISGTASWVYDELVCIDEKLLFSRNHTAKLNSTQEPARETQSPAPLKQVNISSFCGMPKTVPHASLSIQQQYSVGQVLHFKCLTGYNKQLPESGIIMCKNVNGRIIWTPHDAPCTNNS